MKTKALLLSFLTFALGANAQFGAVPSTPTMSGDPTVMCERWDLRLNEGFTMVKIYPGSIVGIVFMDIDPVAEGGVPYLTECKLTNSPVTTQVFSLGGPSAFTPIVPSQVKSLDLLNNTISISWTQEINRRYIVETTRDSDSSKPVAWSVRGGNSFIAPAKSNGEKVVSMPMSDVGRFRVRKIGP